MLQRLIEAFRAWRARAVAFLDAAEAEHIARELGTYWDN